MFYLEPSPRKDDADRAIGTRHPALAAWLGAVVSACANFFSALAPCIELDELSEGQLDDIGASRFARRERWLDCRETPLPASFLYSFPSNPRRSA